MNAPFRDDAVWRAERAAELIADEKELAATLAESEARMKRARARRRGPLFAKLLSVVGIWFVVVALVGGYVVGRYVVTPAPGPACQ
jgi:hypothetical protein